MNKSSKEYILNEAQREGYKFFCIYNASGECVKDQQNANYTPDQAKEDIERFFKHNTGIYRIEFRKAPKRNTNSQKFSFTVDLQEETEQPQQIGNIPGMSESTLFDMLREKDQTISNLQSQLNTQAIQGLQARNELQMDLLRKELKEGQDKSGEMMMQAIQALNGMFGSSNIGLTGLEQEAPTMEAQTDEKTAINKAVVKLIRLDKNFAANVSKLAKLAEEKPDIYKMAVSQLSNF